MRLPRRMIDFVIVAGLTYAWYNVTGVFFKALEGEALALLAIILAFLSFAFIADPLLNKVM